MADFPYMPLFVADYLAKTSHLMPEEHGAYMLLLMTMWQSPECRIPNDDKWLARRFRLPESEIERLFRPVIREFCSNTGNWITNDRLRGEWEHAIGRSKKQSEKAKSRWAREKKSKSAIPTPHPPAMPIKPNQTKPNQEEESLPLPGEGSAPTLFGTPVLSTVETKLPKGPPVRPGKPSVCQPEWEPTPEHHALGDELGLTPREVHESASGMRDWSLSGGHKKLDWNATFRNWIRRDAKERRKSGSGPGGRKSYADIARGDF